MSQLHTQNISVHFDDLSEKNFTIIFSNMFNEINLLTILWNYYKHREIYVPTNGIKQNSIIWLPTDNSIILALLYMNENWEINEISENEYVYDAMLKIILFNDKEINFKYIKKTKNTSTTYNYCISIIPGYIIDGIDMSYISVYNITK